VRAIAQRGGPAASLLKHGTYYLLFDNSLIKLDQKISGGHFGSLVYSIAVWNAGARYSNTSIAEDQYLAEQAVNRGFPVAILDNSRALFTYLRHRNTWNFEMKKDHKFKPTSRKVGWFVAAEAYYLTFAHVLASGPSSQAKCLAALRTPHRKLSQCQVFASWFLAANAGLIDQLNCMQSHPVAGPANWFDSCMCHVLICSNGAEKIDQSSIVNRFTPSGMKWNVKQFGGSKRRKQGVYMLDARSAHPYAVQKHALHNRNETHSILRLHQQHNGRLVGQHQPAKGAGRSILSADETNARRAVGVPSSAVEFLPDCPSVSIDFFIAQLCRYNKALRNSSNVPPAGYDEYRDSTDEISDYEKYGMDRPQGDVADYGSPPGRSRSLAESGVSPLAGGFNVTAFSESVWSGSSCIEFFADSRFQDFPYDFPCRRDCLLSAWGEPSDCAAPAGCSAMGTQSRERHVIVPQNEHGQCADDVRQPVPSLEDLQANKKPSPVGLVDFNLCPTVPCQDSSVIEGQVTMTRIDASLMSPGLFGSSLAQALGVPSSRVQVYRIQEILLDSKFKRALVENPAPTDLSNSKFSGSVAVDFELFDGQSESWARSKSAMSASAGWRLLRHMKLSSVSTVIAEAENSMDLDDVMAVNRHDSVTPQHGSVTPQHSALRLNEVDLRRILTENFTAIVVSFGIVFPTASSSEIQTVEANLKFAFQQTGGTFQQALQSLGGPVIWVVGATFKTPQAGTKPFVLKHLRVVTQPGDSVGDGLMNPQPLVELVLPDNSTASEIGGSEIFVMAQLLTNAFHPSMPMLVSKTGGIVQVSKGIANFTDLRMSSAGQGLQLKFYTLGPNVPAVSIVSSRFNAYVGSLQQAALVVQPGGAKGGRPFSPQPVIDLQDGASNKLNIHHSLFVEAFIISGPPEGDLKLTGRTRRAFRSGRTVFDDLQLNKAGGPYSLGFNISDHTGVVMFSLQSTNVHVAVGPTARIHIAQMPLLVQAGSMFTTQPRVELQDAGGNINVFDNSSRVFVELLDDTATTGNSLLPMARCTPLRRALQGQQATGLTASVDRGASFVYLLEDPSPANPTLVYPLRHGDAIFLADAWTSHLKMELSQDCSLQSNRSAIVQRVRSQLGPGEPSYRLRLLEPWQGPDVRSGVLYKILNGLVAQVHEGVAQFSQLSVLLASQYLQLVFISSLQSDGLWLGRGRPGKGMIGHGYGWSQPANQPLNPLLRLDERSRGLSQRIYAISPYFVSQIGDPASLQISRVASTAYADGTPFEQQPCVRLDDRGSNQVENHPHGTVLVSLKSESQRVQTNTERTVLTGGVVTRLVNGTACFHSLGVVSDLATVDLLFQASVVGFGSFSVVHKVELRQSMMSEFSAFDGQTGDRFGEAVAVDGQFVAVGSPGDASPLPQSQRLEVCGLSTERKQHVQIVRTLASEAPSVQVARIPHNETREGQFGSDRGFIFSWMGVHSQVINPDWHSTFVENLLVASWRKAPKAFSRISVSITKSPLFVDYTITFLGAVGTVDLLEVIGPSSALIEQKQAATVLSGRFALFRGASSERTSCLVSNSSIIEYVAHNATENDFAAAVQRLYGYLDVHVSKRAADNFEMGTFRWAITFGPASAYAIRPDFMCVQGHTLHSHAGNASVVSYPSVLGEGPTTGSFQLRIAEQTSAGISVHASAADVHAATMQIAAVRKLDVFEVPGKQPGCRAWVLFLHVVSVNESTIDLDTHHGFDAQQNIPEFTALFETSLWQAASISASSVLGGSRPSLYLGSLPIPAADSWSSPVRFRQNTKSSVLGPASGSVYVFPFVDGSGISSPSLSHFDRRSRFEEFLRQDRNKLTIKHTRDSSKANSMFGKAVSLMSGTLAVGAPFAMSHSNSAVFSLTCSADLGVLQFAFKEQTAANIQSTATARDLESTLRVSLDWPEIRVISAKGEYDPVCHKSSTRGTSPSSPSANLQPTMFMHVFFPYGVSANDMSVNSVGLRYANGSQAFSVLDLVESSSPSHAPELFNEPDAAVGAVYIFQHVTNGAAVVWDQAGTVRPTHRDVFRPIPWGSWSENLHDRSTTAQFGHSVALSGATMAVGAPGDSPLGLRSGAVYIFRKLEANETDSSSVAEHANWRLGGGWLQQQRLDENNTNFHGGALHEFGSVIALETHTLAVAAIGPGAGSGIVSVYRRHEVRDPAIQPFLPAQRLTVSDWPLLQGESIRGFGKSLALSGNELIVGAPLSWTQSSIHAGVAGFGCILVYRRNPMLGYFVPVQRITPITARQGQHFGFQVALSGNILTAASAMRTSPEVQAAEVLSVRIGAKMKPDSLLTSSSGRSVRSSFAPEWPSGFSLVAGPRSAEVSTPLLPLHASAEQVRQALESHLNIQKVNISRMSLAPQAGFEWLITFAPSDASAGVQDDLALNESPKLRVRIISDSELPWQAIISQVQKPTVPNPTSIQVFTISSSRTEQTLWQHDAQVTHHTQQPADQHGAALAISKNVLIIGAPERAVRGVSSGAAFMHDLRWTNLRIHPSAMAEGQQGQLNVTNCIPECTVMPDFTVGGVKDGSQATLRSMDGDDFGWFGASLGMRSDIRQHSSQLFAADVMPATSQQFGCNTSDKSIVDMQTECQWNRVPDKAGLLSAFDIQGLSDYVPRHQVDPAANNIVFINVSQSQVKTVDVTVSADDVVEVPDEMFRMQLLPDSCVQPMPGGRLEAFNTIIDDTDGGVDTALYATKLLPASKTTSSAQERYTSQHGKSLDTSRHFGASVAFEGDFIISADPSANLSSGAISVFRVILGGSIVEMDPIPLNVASASGCGTSISSTCIGQCGSGSADVDVDGEVWVAVGCEGVRSFQVWVLNVSTPLSSSSWQFRGQAGPTVNPGNNQTEYTSKRLTERLVYHDSDNGRSSDPIPTTALEGAACFEFPSSLSIALIDKVLSDLVVFVGCPGLDATFVFRQPHAGEWLQTSVLLSPTTMHTHLLGVPVVAYQSFGYSLSVQAGEVLIGAPQFYPQAEKLQNDSVISLTEQVGSMQAAAPGAALLWEHTNCTSSPIYEDWDFGGRTFSEVKQYDVLSQHSASVRYCITAPSSHCLAADAIGGCWALTTVFEENAMPDDLDIMSSSFGFSVSLDDNLVAVGAPTSSRQTNVTWNFETADTRGWHLTGAAFEGQPANAKNPQKRSSYLDVGGFMAGSPANCEGNFMLSSYDTQVEVGLNKEYVPVQGDRPTGRASSLPFTIAGSSISLLIGGGCDAEVEFVRLVVDGNELLRATGACSTKMKRLYWDVHLMQGLSAYIEIVDDSSMSPWGHISVDDIRFGWPQNLALTAGPTGAAFIWAREEKTNKEQCRVQHRECEWRFKQRIQPTTSRPSSAFGTAVAASDTGGLVLVGAPNMVVGASSDFAYNRDGATTKPGFAFDAHWGTFGLAQSRTLLLDERHKFNSPIPGEGTLSNQDLSLVRGGSIHSGGLFDSTHSPESVTTQQIQAEQAYAAISAVQQTSNDATVQAFSLGEPQSLRRLASAELPHRHKSRTAKANQGDIGGVYIFRRTPESRGGHTQRQIRPATWDSAVEQAELMPPGISMGSKWGSILTMDKFGRGAVFSAPFDDSAGYPDAGSVWFSNMSVLNTQFAVVDDSLNNVTFPQIYHDDQTHLVASVGSAIKSYVFNEGDRLRKMVIPVYRHGPATTVAHVMYSTRDVSARGVPQSVVDACSRLPFMQRGAALCGDYQASAGILTFLPSRTRVDIEIPIVDDACHEPERKLFIINLSVPGGVKLRGPDYRVSVSIVDDDESYAHQTHAACPTGQVGDEYLISKALN